MEGVVEHGLVVCAVSDGLPGGRAMGTLVLAAMDDALSGKSSRAGDGNTSALGCVRNSDGEKERVSVMRLTTTSASASASAVVGMTDGEERWSSRSRSARPWRSGRSYRSTKSERLDNSGRSGMCGRCGR